MIEKIYKNKEILILVLIIIGSSIWLITKGLSWQHDGDFHYGRIVGLANSIKTGDFIALIHNAYYGYGYAVGIFYSNFFLYIPALLIVLGVPYMISFKILYILINIGTTLSIYFCIKSITKDKKISIISTILYMFSSYRMLDMIVRGALGEMLSFMVLPILILGIYEIIYRDYKKWYYVSIGFTLLALSNIISTITFSFFLFVLVLINIKRFIKDKVRLKYLFISILFALLFSLFFILPILEQKMSSNINIFTVQSKYLPQNNYVGFLEFIFSTRYFKKYLGLSLIMLLPIRFFIKNKKKEIIKFADILYVISIISWICTTRIFPWNIVGKYIEFIQFPWRLLFISTVFLVFSYSIYFMILTEEKRKKLLKSIYTTSIILCIIEFNAYSIQSNFYEKRFTKFKLNDIGTNEYLLYKTDLKKLQKKNISYTTNNKDIKIKYKKNGTNIKIKYTNNNKDNTYIEVPLFNYLGYNSNVKIVNGDNNLIRLKLEDKEGIIKVKYEMTLIQKISYMISFISLIIFLFRTYFLNKKSMIIKN